MSRCNEYLRIKNYLKYTKIITAQKLEIIQYYLSFTGYCYNYVRMGDNSCTRVKTGVNGNWYGGAPKCIGRIMK